MSDHVCYFNACRTCEQAKRDRLKAQLDTVINAATAWQSKLTEQRDTQAKEAKFWKGRADALTKVLNEAQDIICGEFCGITRHHGACSNVLGALAAHEAAVEKRTSAGKERKGEAELLKYDKHDCRGAEEEITELEEDRDAQAREAEFWRVEAKRLLDFVKYVPNILGDGGCSACKCEGCDFEMGEVSADAKEVLAAHEKSVKERK